MTHHASQAPFDPGPRYGYFVVQTVSAPGRVSGVVENLATGEKRPFESTADLAHLLQNWETPGRIAP